MLIGCVAMAIFLIYGNIAENHQKCPSMLRFFCARRPTARDLRQSDCPSMLRFSARRGVLLAICPSMLRFLRL